MSTSAKWTIVAVCLAVLAVLVPWARYGDVNVELSRLPHWWAYLGAAVAAHGAAMLPARVGPPVSAVFGAIALVAAAVVLTGYGDASAIFGSVVPVVRPGPGPGAVFAVASVVAQAVGLRARVRDARPVPA